MFSLLSPVDLSRNSPKGRPGPTRREHHPPDRRRRFVLGPPFFQHRNSRLVEERTGEFWSSGPVASIHPSRGEVGSHPGDRQRLASWLTYHHHWREKRGKSLSTCTPATEQLQSGGSVESGAMRCSCRLAGCTERMDLSGLGRGKGGSLGPLLLCWFSAFPFVGGWS